MTEGNTRNKEYELFMHLVLMLSTSAIQFLGGREQDGVKSSIDLESAGLMIDILDVLQKKTKGNLTKEEEDFLSNTLSALKLQYVNAAETHKKEASKDVENNRTKNSDETPSPRFRKSYG